MLYKINEACEIEKNEDDDDYIVLLGENIWIVNQSAGEILQYFKDRPTTKDDFILLLTEKYSLSENEVLDVMEIFEEFRLRDIICEVGKS